MAGVLDLAARAARASAARADGNGEIVGTMGGAGRTRVSSSSRAAGRVEARLVEASGAELAGGDQLRLEAGAIARGTSRVISSSEALGRVARVAGTGFVGLLGARPDRG
jgi:hypothetical protein